MSKKNLLLGIVIVLSVLTLTGCMPGDGTYTSSSPAGFFWGVWHGWIAPISLIMSFFNNEIRVYESINTGWWYDFGFYIAIVSGFGGLSLTRKKRSNQD